MTIISKSVKEKLWKAFDALENVTDNDVDCLESEEEEAEYAPHQYAARMIFSALKDLGMEKK